MKHHHRKLVGALMMLIASLWIIASPAMVLWVPFIRSTFDESGWALTHRDSGLGCIFHFEWSDHVAVWWLAAFLFLGVIGVFAGILLFRSSSLRSHLA